VTKLTLSFWKEKCRVVNCDKTSGVYGVCTQHEAWALRRYFESAVREEICDRDAPPCFRNQQEWVEYVVAFMLCRNLNERQRNRVDFCRDCTPEFKDEQIRLGKCTHAETVFIRPQRSTEDVVGVSFDKKKKSNAAWENAMLGVSGEIVRLPDEESMNDRLMILSENSKPQKRGPKPK
jgi:hypothetical protein